MRFEFSSMICAVVFALLSWMSSSTSRGLQVPSITARVSGDGTSDVRNAAMVITSYVSVIPTRSEESVSTKYGFLTAHAGSE